MYWSQLARVDHIAQKGGQQELGGLGKALPDFLSYFLNLAPTLGRMKSSIPHEAWRFHFFPNFIFAKVRVYQDLHIHYWNF
jgi:hypothetical protein